MIVKDPTEKFLSADDINFVNELLIEAGGLAVELQMDCFNAKGLEVESAKAQGLLSADEKVSQVLVEKLERYFVNHKVISEEALPEEFLMEDGYLWLVDPIDGTHHYLANDTQYSVMIGLLHGGKPIYGWVYNPAFSMLYFGGPDYGIQCLDHLQKITRTIERPSSLKESLVRVILGRRDKKNNPWLDTMSNVKIIEAGSIGYKLSKILDGEADCLLHLAGRLKIWDTAGPVALALAAGLDVGGYDTDELPYPANSFVHPMAVVMGKKGSLQWFRNRVSKEWIQ